MLSIFFFFELVGAFPTHDANCSPRSLIDHVSVVVWHFRLQATKTPYTTVSEDLASLSLLCDRSHFQLDMSFRGEPKSSGCYLTGHNHEPDPSTQSHPSVK